MNKKLLLIPVALLLVISLIAAGCPTPAPVQLIELNFASFYPPGSYPQLRLYDPLWAEVEKESGGKVKINSYYGESLVGTADAYDSVVKGTVDIADGLQALVVGRFPMDEVMSLPAMDGVCWRPSRVFWELNHEFPEMSAPYSNVKLLWLGSTFITAIGTKDKPIRKLEDNRGLKMIVPGVWPGKRGEALGWTAVPVAPADVYMAIERGVVDGGGIACTYCVMDFRWGEVWGYITLVHYARAMTFVVMNLDKFNSLPPDIQKVFDELTGERMVDIMDRENAVDNKRMLDNATAQFGTEFITLPPEELARWAEVDRLVQEAFIADLEAKGLPGKKLWEKYTQLEKKYSAEEYKF